MNKPIITIVVPTYKRPLLLRRCLGSISGQSHKSFEVIVVDNDGKDSSVKQAVEDCQDMRFKYICQPVSGVSAARNKGIELAKSDLVLFVDDDDEIESEMLIELIKFMSDESQERLSFTWCGVKKLAVDSKQNKLECREFKVSEADLIDMSFITKIGSGGLCVRRDDLFEVGCFDESYNLSEDRDLILKLIEAGKKYKPLHKLLYKRYYHSGARLSEGFHSLIEAEHDYKLYYEHLNFIVAHPELRLRLLDIRAKHYYLGGELEKAIDVELHALQLRPFRMKTLRRLALYYMKAKFSSSNKKLTFNSSAQYWQDRYKVGKNSGVGSYGIFAEFKAVVLNGFVKKEKITTVIEFGSGDGNQLYLAKYNDYTGYDVSDVAVDLCKDRFHDDPSKHFYSLNEYAGETAELSLSLDVIYHLVEDSVFEAYMNRLFNAATKYVIIYSSNKVENTDGKVTHVRHRKFTDWVESHIEGFTLAEHIPNKYPYQGNYKTGSFADFYIYKKK